MIKPYIFAFLSLLWGSCLGAFFFFGLHHTVAKGLGKAQPALWFLGSFLFRFAVVLGGFLLLVRSAPYYLFPALLGFVIARQIVLRITAPKPASEAHLAP